MENIFRLVPAIELTKYLITLDKHDIKDIIIYSIKSIATYQYGNNDDKLFAASLTQLLIKIVAKKKQIQTKGKANFSFTPVEFFALAELVEIAGLDDMPLKYPLQVQIDKIKQIQ